MVPTNLKRRVIVLVLGTTAGSLAITPRSSAQVRFEFTPFGGLYLPTSKVIDQFSTACNCQVSGKQKTNFSLGGRIAAWVSDRLAVEGSFGYSGSGVSITAAGFGSADTSANILTGSARLLIGLGPRALNTLFYLSGGLGLVAHGGAAYTGASGTTRVGAIAGVGARLKVAPSLAVRAELEDYLYSAQFSASSGGGQTNSKFQNDLVLSLGLAIPLGGR